MDAGRGDVPLAPIPAARVLGTLPPVLCLQVPSFVAVTTCMSCKLFLTKELRVKYSKETG